MIKRLALFATGMTLIALLLPATSMFAQGEDDGSPDAVSDQAMPQVDSDGCPAIGSPEQIDAGEDEECGSPANVEVSGDTDDLCPDATVNGCQPTPTAAVYQDDDASNQSDVSNPSEPQVEAAGGAPTPPPTVVQVYCQIPDINIPDQRIVGTFVDSRSGYGDPTVSFNLFGLNGAEITAPTGALPLPATNPIVATPPYPVNWQWGPGGYSKLIVTAVYPSLDLSSYPDATTSLTITCIPATPTPTPTSTSTPLPTPLISPTPIPTRTPVGYSPIFTSIMKDTDGNTILDGDTVSPGTGVYDVAVISGLPPNSTGSVYYWLLNGCQFVSSYGSGWHPFVADGNGVATAPQSATFIVPVSPGGHYDWLVGFTNDDYPPQYLSGCGPETFYVVPPPTPTPTLTPFGDGNALIACFVREPIVPGTAGYKVNVNPLPSSGSVEANLTLLRTDNTLEYKTVTLPPGSAQDLEFYGPYKYAWANLIYRNDNGDIYAVVNLTGECVVTPGPTYTPSPTFTPSVMPTSTSTISPTSTHTPTLTPAVTSTPTNTSTPSPSPTPIATIAGNATSEPTKTPVPVVLPNTGSGASGSSNAALILVAVALLAGLMIGIARKTSAHHR